MSRILFLLKKREDYHQTLHNSPGLITGLHHSAMFMHEMLLANDVNSRMSIVVDGNCVDREVTQWRPSHVIIEALWVTPEKIAQLQRLHPMVKWVIRLHSEIPFMANEGIAMDWLGDYSTLNNVVIAANAPRACREVQEYLSMLNGWDQKTADQRVIYLPNYYPQQYKTKKLDRTSEFVDVGCFGAVRPLKNHLIQALAAVEFAERIGKKLRFHINGNRVEQKGQPVLNNLLGFFQQINHTGHTMVMHDWLDRPEFLELCGQMDVGLQVSFSETFNIVGADIVSQGVPLVCSSELPWGIHVFCANPTDSRAIAQRLLMAYRWPQINTATHRWSLDHYTRRTQRIWVKYFKRTESWESIQ